MKRLALVAILLVAVVGGVTLLLVPGGRAQVQLTLESTMVKGAAGSRVTIVEFSDYQ